MDVYEIVKEFCHKNNISVKLSYDMPAGYETAYGTYDVTKNTLFLNMVLLKDVPRYEVLFYLFHELRHAVQYLLPSLFDETIQKSRFYVVLYNGVCFRLADGQWQSCALEGPEEYFTRAYMSLPYELDANIFAYEKTRELCGDTEALQQLYGFWVPKEKMNYWEHKALFDRIDSVLGEGANR